MSTQVAVPSSAQRPSRDARTERWLVVAAWVAVVLNVLPYYDLPSLIAIPTSLAKIATQGALAVAFVLALAANPQVRLRPNLYLGLLTMLAVVTLMTSLHNQFFVGSTYRAVRMLGFLAVMWLLTPWWGRRDAPLLRAHILALSAIVGSVVLGMFVAPGIAFSYGGRLSGAIWPMPPTQVAHYAAVLLGITLVRWFTKEAPGKLTLVAVVTCSGVLVGTHTRTALLALVLGLAVAGASLFLGHARVRRVSVTTLAIGVLVATWFAPALISWALRGQNATEAVNLTGRTLVWSQVLAVPRDAIGDLFGSGMSNQSFNGLPIDSNWVSTYLDEGVFGISVQVSLIVVLLVTAVTRPRGSARALALFLVVYCLSASFTETGLSSPTTYLLDLTLAASLLARPAARGG